MDKVIKMILVKYFIIVTLVLIYVAIALAYIGPAINHAAFGQSAFDATNQYQQYQDPYNQGYQQQYQQPYQDPYGYQNQYQQYGTPTYSPYGMQQPYGYQQGYIPQAQNPIQFGTSEVIYTLLGGGAIGYARYNQTKRNQDKELTRELYAELLREKQEKRELARVSYQQMPNQGNNINDAPSVRLENLDKNISEFSEKVAKA